MNLVILLFNNFETLDVFGPVEIFGKAGYKIQHYSMNGGLVTNRDGISILTKMMDGIYFPIDILLIPGGMGTRVGVNSFYFIDKIKELANRSKYVLTVCTGSALLATTGLLDGKRATSNKGSFEWVKSCSKNVDWIRQARWVVDGKYYTSSGISAGIDMALGFVRDTESLEKAKRLAFEMEYNWQQDNDKDDYCNQ